MSLTVLFSLANTNNCFSQNCPQDAKTFEDGYPKLKACKQNLGWRESVNQYEWKVTVYNFYDDMKVKISFKLIEEGTPAKNLSYYTISKKKGSQSYSYFFSSEPKFVYGDIELIDDPDKE